MTLLLALLLVPLLLVTLALAGTPVRWLTRAAAVLAWLQLALTARVALPRLQPGADALVLGGFRCDAAAAWFLLLTMLVAAAALTHAVGFFERDLTGPHASTPRGIRQFYGFTALFIASMGLACCADNLGFLWISIEATTLTSAPLVYHHRSRTSLEATWKYLLICSVGIAFAFFGTALLYSASQQTLALSGGSLSLAALTAQAAQLPPALLRLGFVFMLLGYGTKAGLFPIHTWLPDAHSEAPAPASAMLSGALLNCALLALWRTSGLLLAAHQQRFLYATLLPLGLATVLAASLMLLRQRDLKRLLAYSSMENVGLMATAIALGNGPGLALQALCHSLAKVALFLLAGNLLQDYGSKALADIRGLQRRRPQELLVLALAVAAVAGTPPFGSFAAEWQILGGAADAGRWLTVALLCAGLAVAFVALAIHLAGMAWGEAPADLAETGTHRGRLAVPALLVALSLALGVALPPALYAAAQGVAR